MGEGQALGKRRGLREDKRLRVRALENGSFPPLPLTFCAGAEDWPVGRGAGHEARPFFFFPPLSPCQFPFSPLSRRRTAAAAARASWAAGWCRWGGVGEAPREREVEAVVFSAPARAGRWG